MVGEIRRALADRNPVPFLALASTLMAITDPRQRDPFGRQGPGPEPPGRDELVSSFIDVPLPEMSALLAAFGAFTDDEVLAARIRRELSARPRLEPRWLERLDDVATSRAVCMSHVLGDGDNIILGNEVPGAREFTTVLYIDHNLGSLVKDAMVIPQPSAVIIAKYRELADDPGTRFDDLPLADARARIDDAIALAARTYPPIETEEWPAARALMEWIVRALPTGGRGYEIPEWTERDRLEIAARFFASPHGPPFDNSDCREMLDNLLWFGTDFAIGDPMRWSAVRVEMLLDDWVPRKIDAPVGDLMAVPALLRAYIRFAHGDVGIPSGLTEEVLAAVDHCEPSYQAKIAGPRLQGVDALLDAMGFEAGRGISGDYDFAQDQLAEFERQVGGAERLATVDDVPLPDEPFRWDGIPDDAVAPVERVLALADECCDEMFDMEMRTACRRVLARMARTDPRVFLRAKRSELSAAALVWIVAQVNDRLGLYYGYGGPQVRDLAAHFGVTTPSQKSEALLRAGGFEPRVAHELALGSPEYLVGARRRDIVESRDRYRVIVAEAEPGPREDR